MGLSLGHEIFTVEPEVKVRCLVDVQRFIQQCEQPTAEGRYALAPYNVASVTNQCSLVGYNNGTVYVDGNDSRLGLLINEPQILALAHQLEIRSR